MTKTKEHAVSRRTFVKGSALAGLGTAALGTGTLFACSPQQEGSGGDAVSTEPVEEQIVWTHCAHDEIRPTAHRTAVGKMIRRRSRRHKRSPAARSAIVSATRLRT